MGAGSYYRGEIILDNHLFTEAYRPENHFKISRFGEVFKAQPATQPSSQDPEDLDLRLVAEQVAECALSPSDPTAHISPLHLEGDSVSTNLNSPTRPEWQKLCIQYSVCIHNIYGNCAYNNNCYYHHLEDFKKPDLLFKTEMCRYGSDCVNRSRCCFAHSKSEKRTPEHNVRESLAKNRVLSFPAAVFPVNPAMSIHGPASTLTPNRFSSSPTRMEPLHRRHRSPSPSFGSVDAISGHHMGFQSLAPLPLDF